MVCMFRGFQVAVGIWYAPRIAVTKPRKLPGGNFSPHQKSGPFAGSDLFLFLPISIVGAQRIVSKARQ